MSLSSFKMFMSELVLNTERKQENNKVIRKVTMIEKTNGLNSIGNYSINNYYHLQNTYYPVICIFLI